MKIVRYHEAAETELLNAVGYLELQKNGLGSGFSRKSEEPSLGWRNSPSLRRNWGGHPKASDPQVSMRPHLLRGQRRARDPSRGPRKSPPRLLGRSRNETYLKTDCSSAHSFTRTGTTSTLLDGAHTPIRQATSRFGFLRQELNHRQHLGASHELLVADRVLSGNVIRFVNGLVARTARYLLPLFQLQFMLPLAARSERERDHL